MLIGQNSLAACNDPARHRHLRQLIMPALSIESVESYLQDIHAIVDSTLVSSVLCCNAHHQLLDLHWNLRVIATSTLLEHLTCHHTMLLLFCEAQSAARSTPHAMA